MASIYDLKPRFQALLRPATGWLAAKGVTANQVTITAFLLSLAAGSLVAAFATHRGILLLVPIALLVRMTLNAIDGMLAREHDMRSRLGAVLNELGDVFADAAIYLPLAWVEGIRPAWIVIFVVLGIVTEMAGVIAVQIGADRRYDGPLGKSDRAFAIGFVCVLLGCGVQAGTWLNFVLVALIVLATVTIVRRSRRALCIAADSHPGDT